jgi:hypothetical protein
MVLPALVLVSGVAAAARPVASAKWPGGVATAVAAVAKGHARVLKLQPSQGSSDGRKQVRIVWDGMTLATSARRFGRAVARQLASSPEPEAAVLAAAVRSAAGRGSEAAAPKIVAGDEYDGPGRGIEHLKRVLGLPFYALVSPDGGRTIATQRVRGRRASGPLSPRVDDPNVVEGVWRVGRSNGGILKSLVSRLAAPRSWNDWLEPVPQGRTWLRRGMQVGLRASVEDGQLYVTIFPQPRSAGARSYTFVAVDGDEEPAVSYRAVPPEKRPALHRLPLLQ